MDFSAADAIGDVQQRAQAYSRLLAAAVSRHSSKDISAIVEQGACSCSRACTSGLILIFRFPFVCCCLVQSFSGCT